MSKKRANSWVDLTGEDDENPPPQRKHARVSINGPSTQPPPSQSLSSHPSSQRDSWVDSTAQVGEEDDIIDLTQDRDEASGWLCVGIIEDKIVGVRYYNGMATPGEQVMIRREPGNPYDSNAIRINNVQEVQIGHLPRTLAAKLAPFIASSIPVYG
jgi:SWI/SNF-related matrix-associated actin-dependent regulator of chromatin subfamily A3